MNYFRRSERGAVSSALVVTVLSAVLGAGAATAAVVSVVSSQGPDDSAAVQQGQKDLVDPGTIINYGG